MLLWAPKQIPPYTDTQCPHTDNHAGAIAHWGAPWYLEADIATEANGIQGGNWLQLTEWELPDDVESLLAIARASHWMFSQLVTDDSVRAMCDKISAAAR